MILAPNRQSGDRGSLLVKILFGPTTLVGVAVLCLSALFLLRQQSALQQQIELRAQTLASSLASQSEFALLVGDGGELKRMADFALAGNPDVLYVVAEGPDEKTIVTAARAELKSSLPPRPTGKARSMVIRHLRLGPEAGMECVEADAPAIARPERGLFNPQSTNESVLGSIRIGVSLAVQESVYASTVRHVAGIAVLIFLVAFVIEHFRQRQRRAQERLRQIEERLESIVTLSPAVLYAATLGPNTFSLTFMGDNARQVLGFNPEDFASPGLFRARIHPDDRARVEAAAAALLGGEQETAEYRFLHSNGSYRWIQDHVRTVRDASGRPQEVIGSLFDVTERKEAEEALRKSELRYRDLTEMLPQMVFECDSDGRVTFMNQSGLDALGLARKELEGGVNALELMDPSDRQRGAEGLLSRLSGDRSGPREYLMLRQDGSRFPGAVYSAPILSDGKPVGVRGILIDISDRKQAEETLREWAILVQSSNDAIVKEMGGRIVFWNAGAEQMLGYGAREIVGRPLQDIIPPERCQDIPRIMSLLEQGEIVAHFETQGLRKDGRRVDTSLSVTPLRDAQGRLTGSVGIMRDMSEIQAEQRELLKRNSLLELLQASAVAANQAVSAEEAIQTCLDNICSHTGWSVGHAFVMPEGVPSGLTSSGLWHFDEPQGLDQFREASERLVIQPGVGLAGRVLATGRPCWVADLALDTGLTRSALATELGLKAALASPILAGPEVVGVMEFFSAAPVEADDPLLEVINSIGVQLGRVIERKRAEEAVRKASQTLSAVVENSPLAIVTLDVECTVQSWNAAAEKLFGWPRQEVIGRPLLILPSPPDEQYRRGVERVLAGETVVHEARRVCQDGRLVEVNVWGAPLPGPCGAIMGMIVEYADLSERKLLEAQLRQAQRLESIGQLAAGLAHEINTPIQYVGDNTHFLEEAFGEVGKLLEIYDQLLAAARSHPSNRSLVQAVDALAERADFAFLRQEIPKAICESLEGVGRVAQIVGAMKAFSHPGPAEFTAVDLNRAIESTVLVCRNEWKYVADLVTELDHDLPPVLCLPGEINQVILNLVINAAHAIADVVEQQGGKGTITITTAWAEDWVEVRVRDTGTGIPAEVRPRIFDPFFTTKEVGKGTGQGLALAHSVVVQKHGGTIHFETEMGAGTVFIIRLPLRREVGV